MISLETISIDPFVCNLRTLVHLLAVTTSEAERRHFEPAVLLDARLAPDMFELRKHVQMACFNVRDWVACVTGAKAQKPALGPADLADLTNLVQATIAELEALPNGALADAADRTIEIPIGNDLVIAMNGLEMLRDWSLPQLYFHVTTVFAILRHNGAPIGIQDFGKAAIARHVRPRAS